MSKSVSNKQLFQSIKAIIQQAQQHVVRNINTTMLITYFEIGRMIVEDEQQGNQRATYAKGTIPQLSKQLTQEFGKGYSTANLEYMRQFYSAYKSRISQTNFGKSKNNNLDSPISQTNFGKSKLPFSLSWSHYIQLLKIKDENERSFYEIEATQNNWNLEELKRQFNTAIYERIALSKDKKAVKELSKKGQIIEAPTDVFKKPLCT